MTVREAIESDIPRIVEMCARLTARSGYTRLLEYDIDSVVLTVSELIESDSGVVLVYEDEKVAGVVAALIFPMYLNRNHLTAQELWMWVDPEYRGRAGKDLMKGLEDAVRKKGAKSLSVTAQHTIRPEATGRLYRRAGFYPTDYTYMKGI